jgi:hypothetical protein
VQSKYRNDLEAGSEEFTHMRCKFLFDESVSVDTKTDSLRQIPLPLAIPMISRSRTDTISDQPCTTVTRSF